MLDFSSTVPVIQMKKRNSTNFISNSNWLANGCNVSYSKTKRYKQIIFRGYLLFKIVYSFMIKLEEAFMNNVGWALSWY